MKQKKAGRSNPNRWQDHYTRKAKKENYPARSVYKLQEIQKKSRLIRKGDRVLDLGCAPGAWLLYAAEETGPSGRVVGVDLKPVTVALPPQASAMTMDAHDLSMPGTFDVVLSDMAPDTTGSKHVDAIRSIMLCEAALEVALRSLRPGGNFACKVFQGADFKAFSDRVRAAFAGHRIFKPESSRKGSREVYIIATGKKETEIETDSETDSKTGSSSAENGQH